MLICYTVIGFIVYIVLLLLGEMATQYPVAGSFNVYTTRFVDEAFGFGISWNYCVSYHFVFISSTVLTIDF
jgi:AAT family amino acid transporter